MLPCLLICFVPPQTTPIPRPQRVLDLSLEFESVPLSFETSHPATRIGRRALLFPSERAMGTDLNGDGDQLDHIFHTLDLARGTLANLGVTGSSAVTLDPASEDWAMTWARESWLGGDQDGDGDSLDEVHLALDLANGRHLISGLPTETMGILPFASLQDGLAFLSVTEWDVGIDFDGDGVLGYAGFAWDLSKAGLPQNLFTPAIPPLAGNEGHFLFELPEKTAGDLNGDGDALDAVLHAWSTANGSLVNTGLVVNERKAIGEHIAFTVVESEQSLDLNGDGDLRDYVLHVHENGHGAIRNLGFAVEWPHEGGHGLSARDSFVLGERAVAFFVPEFGQGDGDLNGDGDLQDTVLYVHDFERGSTRNLGLAAWEGSFGASHFVFQGREDQQGTDWNNDGDLLDFVTQVHDLDLDATWNTGLPHPRRNTLYEISGRWCALEAQEQGVDRNGDGDTTDIVLAVLDLRTGGLRGPFLAPEVLGFTAGLWSLGNGFLVYGASELANAVDFDGSGSLAGTVLRVYVPGLDLHVPTSARITSLLPPHGSRFLVSALEPEAGTDLNGDGDALDGVVLRARLKHR